MKKSYKLIILIIISLFLTNYSFAKEIRTRFGFFIDLPSEFVAIQDQNLSELMQEYEGSDMDKEFFNEFMAGSSKSEMNIEYYFPQKIDPERNSININYQRDTSLDEIIKQVDLANEVCPYYLQVYKELFKKNIKQYYCKFNNNFKFKYKNIIHIMHDGPFEDTYMIQYQFDVNRKMLTLTVGCQIKHCKYMENVGTNIIKSIN